MNKLFTASYYFEQAPGLPNLLAWRVIMIGSGVLIVVGVLCLVMARRWKNDGIRRHMWQRFAGWSLTIAPIFYLLAFFRYQHAYFLSMRLWLAAWILLAVVWVLWLIKIRLVNIPRRIKAREAKDEYSKYLPQRK